MSSNQSQGPSPAVVLTRELPLRCRTVFVSDVHLGFAGCSAEKLLGFLRGIETETLYLVGDIIDLSCASSALEWPEAHHEVIRTVLGLAEMGTRVIYVPGNHDSLVRQLDGARVGKVEIRRELVHQTADGRSFLVLHGDEFDGVSQAHPWLEALGGRAYGVLLGLDQKLTTLGLPGTIAGTLKQAVKSKVRQKSNFEGMICEEVRRRELDGLICGHIHRAEMLQLDGGVLYCNDGDWVESCTALREDFDGRLSLLQWKEGQRVVLQHEADAKVVQAA